MVPDPRLTPAAVEPFADRFLSVAEGKCARLARKWMDGRDGMGAPVFTRAGKYTARGWTEWTQGFLFGGSLLVFDATGDRAALDAGIRGTLDRMAPHVSHIGVHDHGFNNVSTYGTLRRLILEGKVADEGGMLAQCELALKVSGAVQAARWTATTETGGGYVYSFNGPHSLFCDTIRSCRSLVLAHQLGHALMGENDRPVSLLDRAAAHIRSTLAWNVFYGEGRDIYDVPGRVAHESLFNVNDGKFRCPSTQQGYSPFSTWTRGLAWVLLGCAEQLEWFSRPCVPFEGKTAFLREMERAARATADFYLRHSSADGIPFWDTGAPGLAGVADYAKTSDPWSGPEPVDSSAAAISAQGLIRLGLRLGNKGGGYLRAGLGEARTLFSPPYLSESPKHEGLLLHSVYHRPRGWDYVPKGRTIPCGESSLWGDYHALELAVLVKRLARRESPVTFFAGG
ncbi:MAG TPA: glycosyl hydrolase [Candidatus Hydrogenedentes bacterium]|nr:glycosyl hydrolase [Candidatus Hydrogenedentota bacterium]